MDNIFDWTEYKTLAEYIENNNLGSVSEECRVRNAVSRLYYFALNHLIKFAEKKGFKKQKHGIHGALRKHLREKGKVAVAEAIRSLQELREKCDYEDDLKEEPKDVLGNAKMYLEQIKPILNNARWR